MQNKKILFGVLLSTLAFSACADGVHDLDLVNNTNQDSTAIINGGACSTSLPNGYGITKAHSSNHIPGRIVKGACGRDRQENCSAKVYMTNHCHLNGEKEVADAEFNVNTGDVKITMTEEGKKQGYNLHPSDQKYLIIMDGGPSN